MTTLNQKDLHRTKKKTAFRLWLTFHVAYEQIDYVHTVCIYVV